MIDLKKVTGLPVELTDDNKLKFSAPLADRESTFIRKFSEMVPVLMDQSIKVASEEMYRVYRNIVLPQHEELVKKYHLTYDITIIPPVMLGREFNKLLGHYHANIPGKNIAHPEVYEIYQGRGLVVLQKMDPEFKNVINVLIAEVQAGDKIIYPPNYGHIVVNIGKEVLVIANWLSTDYKPLYKEVSDKRGMAYYVVAGKNQPYELIPNQAYKSIPPVHIVNKEFMKAFPISALRSMYIKGMEHPEYLDFLNHPDKYAVELSSISS